MVDEADAGRLGTSMSAEGDGEQLRVDRLDIDDREDAVDQAFRSRPWKPPPDQGGSLDNDERMCDELGVNEPPQDVGGLGVVVVGFIQQGVER